MSDIFIAGWWIPLAMLVIAFLIAFGGLMYFIGDC